MVRREPLEKTGKLFGGLINDMKYRFPFYVSDFVDGLNSQCVAATIFMYFAALSTAITFGGLLSDKTHNLIGKFMLMCIVNSNNPNETCFRYF